MSDKKSKLKKLLYALSSPKERESMQHQELIKKAGKILDKFPDDNFKVKDDVEKVKLVAKKLIKNSSSTAQISQESIRKVNNLEEKLSESEQKQNEYLSKIDEFKSLTKQEISAFKILVDKMMSSKSEEMKNFGKKLLVVYKKDRGKNRIEIDSLKEKVKKIVSYDQADVTKRITQIVASSKGGGLIGRDFLSAGSALSKRYNDINFIAGTNITISLADNDTAKRIDMTLAASGSGTVTSVSVVTANGVSGTVANPTTTPAITLTLGAITPTSVAASGTVTGSNLSGTNTGDQTITLTSEATGSGTGSFAVTLSNSAVIGKVLTGYVSGAGTVAATDTILQAIQKLNGNVAALVTGVSSVSGTTNRITASPTTGAVVVDISASYVGQTSITTLGTVATGTWNSTLIGTQYGGTGADNHLATVGAVPYYSSGTVQTFLAATITASKMLLSGASAAPTWSTSTIPTSAGATAGKVLVSDGTNYVLSTPTFPNASATSGKIIQSDGTNWIASTATFPTAATLNKILVGNGTNYVESTPTFPNASASSGKFIRSDGTNWIASTPTLPTSAGTAGKILASDGTNYVESTPTFPYSASATSGKIIKSDGTNWVASTETYAAPSTNRNIMTSDGTNWTSDSDVYTVALTDYTGSTTLTGWTTPLSGNTNLSYRKVGKHVMVWFSLDGTSNATSTSFTLPYQNNTGFGISFWAACKDNGVAVPGEGNMPNNSSTVNFYTSVLGGSWTNTGAKSILGYLEYYTTG